MNPRLRIVLLIFGVLTVVGRIASCSRDADRSVVRTAPAPAFSTYSGSAPATVRQGGTVGSVRLHDIYTLHPLAAVLAADDRQLLTMRLLAQTDATMDQSRAIAAAQNRMQHELQTIAVQAQKKLNARAAELTALERRDMNALLTASAHQASSDRAAADTIDHADAAMAQLARTQHRDFSAGVGAEQRQVLAGARAGLATQDNAALQLRAEQYTQAENAYAAELAQRHTDRLISLRLRLADTHLAPAEHDRAAAELRDLQQSQVQDLAARKAADLKSLTQYADDLRDHRAIAATAISETAASEGRKALEIDQAQAALATPAPAPVVTAAPVDARLRSELSAIHARYQNRFAEDERRSVADFAAKRTQFQNRLRDLGQADQREHAATLQNYATLQTARGRVQEQMAQDVNGIVAQIAARRGLHAVIADPLGSSAGVVDITPDVLRELQHRAGR